VVLPCLLVWRWNKGPIAADPHWTQTRAVMSPIWDLVSSLRLQLFAMPETLIGLHPDIGASYFLPRLPGYLGECPGYSSSIEGVCALLVSALGIRGSLPVMQSSEAVCRSCCLFPLVFGPALASPTFCDVLCLRQASTWP